MYVVFKEHPCLPGWEPLLWSSASIWPEGRSNLPMRQAESWQTQESMPPLLHSEGPKSPDGHSRLQHPPGLPPTSLSSPCSFWVMPLLQPDTASPLLMFPSCWKHLSTFPRWFPAYFPVSPSSTKPSCLCSGQVPTSLIALHSSVMWTLGFNSL